MGSRHMDVVLGALSAKWEAALQREEEEAAVDMAASLFQDQPLVRFLAGAGALDVEWCSGRTERVAQVASDHVSTGGSAPLLVPLARAVLVRRRRGVAPQVTDETLGQVLRRRARESAQVHVGVAGTEVRGALVKASPDHVVVRTSTAEFVLPAERIDFLRMLRQG